MNASARCPKCNAVLAPGAGGPICPACLMRGVLKPTDSELAGGPVTETVTVGRTGSWDSSQSMGATARFTELATGFRFGDYCIVGRLGRGGMGVVYEADHVPSGRRVALKILAQSLDQPEARARFLREGLLAASINHPNSVYVYGTEEIDGIPTIAMELVDGGTLAQCVKANGPMGIPAAVDAVMQIIDGLSAAEARGVLHRDVKPSNCFVSRDGTVKVGDFGLSISTTGNPINSQDDVTIEGTFLGTPAFASPEQLRGEPLDKRSDIYAVGVTLFYLLIGKVPFEADNMVHLLATVLDRPAPSMMPLRNDLPAELDAVVVRCLQKSPGSRFETYDALRDALRPFSSQSPIPASPGNRFLAGIVDELICGLILMPINLLIQFSLFSGSGFGVTQEPVAIAISVLLMSLVVAYFAISEWKFGCTLGKWVVGLRVVMGSQRPSLSMSAVRAVLYLIVPAIPSLIYNATWLSSDPADPFNLPSVALPLMLGLIHYVLKYGLFLPMRANNGYQAIHDSLTGTRVFERNGSVNRSPKPLKPDAFEFDPQGSKIGPYHRLQTIFKRDEEELVLGYDAKLLRRVWLHLRPDEADATLPNLHAKDDPARLRWLGGRRSETECWDCYEVPSGDLLTLVASQASGSRAIRIMRHLIHRIASSFDENTSRSPSSPSDQPRSDDPISLYRVWVTDLDEIKCLPFEFVAPGNVHPVRASERSRSSAGVDVIRQAAQSFLDPIDRPEPFRQTWSVGSLETLRRFTTIKTVGDAMSVINNAERERPIRLSARVVAMYSVALLFPILSGLCGLLMLATYQYQRRQYPQIDRLHEMAEVIRQLDLDISTDHAERVLSLRRYATIHFDEALNDPALMQTLYAIYKLPPSDRDLLRDAMLDQPIDAQEIQEAGIVYDQVHTQWADSQTNRREFPFEHMMSMIPAYIWMEFIWIPSMITAMIFRGGVLMRLFGVVLVNRNQQPASRLRVVWRMFISGLPVLAITMIGITLMVTGFAEAVGAAGSIAIVLTMLLIAAGAMLIVPVIRGGRSLSDFLAGTYYMVR